MSKEDLHHKTINGKTKTTMTSKEISLLGMVLNEEQQLNHPQSDLQHLFGLPIGHKYKFLKEIWNPKVFLFWWVD